MDISKEEVKTKIKRFIRSTFLLNNPTCEFADEDSFMEKGIIDSTGVLEVINFLQTDFGIEVLDSEVLPENIDSVSNIASYVSRKTGIPV